MGMKIVTGYTGTAHVTAEADGALNAGIFGPGRYVLNIGDKFAFEVQTNNLIRIKNGYALNQGRLMELPVNEYEDITIENGMQGVKRVDIIAVRYEKDAGTGVESASLVVVKGVSGDDYADPEIATGNILAGDMVDEMPLYRIKLNGINIEEVEQIFIMKESFDESTKIKSFGSLDDLGASAENTLAEIMDAMPVKSTLTASIASSATAALNKSLPFTASGILMIEKSGSVNGRGFAISTKLQSGETYLNDYYNGSFIGWQKLVLESDLPQIQSGIYEVQIVSASKTDHTITFNVPFTSVPAVQISKAFSVVVPTAKPYNVDMLIKSVSKTKMVITVWSDSGSTPFDIHWTAIAK